MKRILLVILPLLLLLSACDRYEHETFSDAAIEADMQSFFTVLETAVEDNLDNVLAWYSDDYMQDEVDKPGVELNYQVYFLEYGYDLVLSGEIVEYWKTGRVVWELYGNLPDTGRGEFLIAEIEDFLITKNGSYVFYGNQVKQHEIEYSKPVVLAQFFTATTCGNCPEAATKLEEMHNEYGEQLVVLEYVADSDPGGAYYPEAMYYGGAQPSAIFQGEYLVVGAGEASLGEYDARYQQIVSNDAIFRFRALGIEVNENTIIANLIWETLGELDGDDLMLQAVVLEEDPDMYYIFSPSVYFENRVMAKEEIAFDENLTSAEITLDVTIDPEATYSVVVWLQNRPGSWTNDTGHVYNVIKKEMGE